MSKLLDRNRKYGTVYGHKSFRFHQDGVYFDAKGFPAGGKSTKAAVKAAPDDEPPVVVENVADNSQRIAKLNKMSVPALKKLAVKVADQLDLEMPEAGKGAKARYVRFLVDNTTD